MKKSKILVIALIVLLVALGAGAILIFGNNIGLTYAILRQRIDRISHHDSQRSLLCALF